MKTVRLLCNGDIQVLVLPAEYRFDVHEVAIKRIGTAVVLVPRTRRRPPPVEGSRQVHDESRDGEGEG